MFFSRTTALCCLLTGLAGCAKSPAPAGPSLLAVLPFENLSGSPEFDWLARAAPIALTEQLSGDPGLRVIQVAAKRDADLAGATQYLYGAVEGRGDSLRIRLWREDAALNTTLGTIASAAVAKTSPLRLIDTVARQLGAHVLPFSTTNEEAFRNFGLGLITPDLPAAIELWRKATGEDPAFSTAYEVWARTVSSRGDRQAAESLIESAKPAFARMQPAARARLEMLDATLRGDAGKQAAAMQEIASPADPAAQAELGSKLMEARRYPEAVKALQASLKVKEQQPNVWNALGYAQAYQGDLNAAKSSLERSAALSPNEPNPLDSLGEVHYLLGKFPEAGKYFEQAFEKNNSFLNGASLEKAASSYYMAGDAAKARDCIARFLAARKAANDPFLILKDAQWKYTAGRKGEAEEELRAQATAMNETAQTVSLVQLALWLVSEKKTAPAQEAAKAAIQSARNDTSRLIASIGFVTALDLPDAAAYKARIQQIYPQPQAEPVRRAALAYALYVHGFTSEALPLWKEFYTQTTRNLIVRPNAAPYAALLARAGNEAEARSVLTPYPVPQFVDEDLFRFLSFPFEMELRASLLRAAGQTAEAARWQAAYVASQK